MKKHIPNKIVYHDSGKGDPIILIHGFPLCRKMWNPQISALNGAGLRVIVADNRGFGESKISTESQQSMDYYADDIISILDELGLEKSIIGGMSMGGYILLNLLERYPERISKALFMVTRAEADTKQGKEMRTDLINEVKKGNKEAVANFYEKVLFCDETFSSNMSIVEEVREWMLSTPANTLAQGLKIMCDRKDYLSFLHKISVPTLIIGAEQDKTIPVESSRKLYSGIPGAELKILPNVGHMANMEDPESFNRILLEFLNEQ